MQLIYANPENTTIQATLDAGETLGHVSGPTVAFVPVDPANAEYQAILASGEPIAPYQAPAPPTETVIAQSAQSLKLAQAESAVRQGRTDDAVLAILAAMKERTA